MNQKQLNAKLRYEIKFYLVWNSEAFKENHNILFGEVLWWIKYSNILHIFEISLNTSLFQ